MTKAVRIFENSVVEIFSSRPVLHESLMAQIREDAPDEVEQGWTYDGVRYAAPPPPPPPNARDYAAAVQAKLDMTAQERDYDNILSACSYVGSDVAQFAGEAVALRAWRDRVWSYFYDTLADIETERATRPAVDALVAALPSFSWPD